MNNNLYIQIMKFKYLFFWAFMAVGLLASCSSDDDQPTEIIDPVDYLEGYYVVNEGVFGSGDASVSLVNLEGDYLVRDLYGEANDGAALGDVGQSIGFYGEYAFIIVNVSQKVVVVDRSTFEEVATIDQGLVNPRYITFLNDKAYISDWGDGSDPMDDVIAEVDLESFEIINKIVVPEGPEKIQEHQGSLYVTFIGGWGFNDIVGVIQPEIQNLQEYQVGVMPNSMAIEDGSLWIAANGYPNYTGEESAGKITQFDLATMEVVQEFELPNATDHPGNLVVEDGQVYFTIGKQLYSFSTQATELPTEPVAQLSEVTVLASMTTDGELLLVTSRNADFTGNGKLLVYDLNNYSLINTYDVGVNPSEIYVVE